MLGMSPAGTAGPPWALRGDATLVPFRRGILAFIRYSESNVGPYDELLWLQPFQRQPGGRGHQIPLIFVSSEASAQSGRVNWGLPKELAVFRVSSLADGSERVEVSRSGQLVASFARSCPRGALAFDSRWLPRWARRLVQLSGGRRFETLPQARGRYHLIRISQLEINRALLPDAHASRSRWGICVSHLELCFPAARIFEISS
jgi:hypothetical protein